MTEQADRPTCRWVSSTEPRVIPGRHADDCADRHDDDANGCRGCLPCAQDHEETA